jgi:hypothetical protein
MADGISSGCAGCWTLALDVADDQRPQVRGSAHAVVRRHVIQVLDVLDVELDGHASLSFRCRPAGHVDLVGFLHYRGCGCGIRWGRLAKSETDPLGSCQAEPGRVQPAPLLTSDHAKPRQTLAAGIFSRMTTCGIQPAREQVLLSQIVFDEGLYPRVEGHDPATVQTYVRDMEQIEAAGKLISINADGILLDGRHRMLAYKTRADGADPEITVYRYAISSKLESFRLACELQDRGFALNNNDRQASAKRLYALGDQSQADIAKVLGVCSATVSSGCRALSRKMKEPKRKKLARCGWLAPLRRRSPSAAEVPCQTIRTGSRIFRNYQPMEFRNSPGFDPTHLQRLEEAGQDQRR